MLRCLFVAGFVCLGVARADAQQAQSLSLEEALGAAERASEQLEIARANVERAQSQVLNARAGYLPTVNGSAAYQRTLRSEFDGISFGPPSIWVQPTPSVTISVCPAGWVCHAVRAPGSKWTIAPLTREGSGR